MHEQGTHRQNTCVLSMRELQINIYTFGVNNGLKMLKQSAVQKRTVTRMSLAFFKMVKVTLRSVAGIMHALRGHYQGIFRSFVVWGRYFRLYHFVLLSCVPLFQGRATQITISPPIGIFL